MAAKRILTSRAKSGMVTADDVYTSDNQLVIPKGTVLTEEILKALKDYSISVSYTHLTLPTILRV